MSSLWARLDSGLYRGSFDIKLKHGIVEVFRGFGYEVEISASRLDRHARSPNGERGLETKILR